MKTFGTMINNHNRFSNNQIKNNRQITNNFDKRNNQLNNNKIRLCNIIQQYQNNPTNQYTLSFNSNNYQLQSQYQSYLQSSVQSYHHNNHNQKVTFDQWISQQAYQNINNNKSYRKHTNINNINHVNNVNNTNNTNNINVTNNLNRNNYIQNQLTNKYRNNIKKNQCRKQLFTSNNQSQQYSQEQYKYKYQHQQQHQYTYQPQQQQQNSNPTYIQAKNQINQYLKIINNKSKQSIIKSKSFKQSIKQLNKQSNKQQLKNTNNLNLKPQLQQQQIPQISSVGYSFAHQFQNQPYNNLNLKQKQQNLLKYNHIITQPQNKIIISQVFQDQSIPNTIKQQNNKTFKKDTQSQQSFKNTSTINPQVVKIVQSQLFYNPNQSENGTISIKTIKNHQENTNQNINQQVLIKRSSQTKILYHENTSLKNSSLSPGKVIYDGMLQFKKKYPNFAIHQNINNNKQNYDQNCKRSHQQYQKMKKSNKNHQLIQAHGTKKSIQTKIQQNKEKNHNEIVFVHKIKEYHKQDKFNINMSNSSKIQYLFENQINRKNQQSLQNNKKRKQNIVQNKPVLLQSIKFDQKQNKIISNEEQKNILINKNTSIKELSNTKRDNINENNKNSRHQSSNKADQSSSFVLQLDLNISDY